MSFSAYYEEPRNASSALFTAERANLAADAIFLSYDLRYLSITDCLCVDLIAETIIGIVEVGFSLSDRRDLAYAPRTTIVVRIEESACEI